MDMVVWLPHCFWSAAGSGLEAVVVFSLHINIHSLTSNHNPASNTKWAFPMSGWQNWRPLRPRRMRGVKLCDVPQFALRIANIM